MAQFNFMNYGAAVQQGQQINRNRMANEALGMDLEEQKRILKQREQAKKIREEVERMPDAIEEMEAMGLFDEAAKLRDYYVGQQMNSIKLVSSMRDHIDETNYKQFRQDMIAAGAVEPNLMPTEYSDDWFRKELEKQRGALNVRTRKWANQGVTFAQDFIDQDGSIVWEGTPYEDAADKNARKPAGGGKPWQMEAGDTNAIRNSVQQLYGAIWDPVNQQFSGLNKTQQAEAAAITEEAARIYNENEGRLPHSMAVSRAARKMGVNIQDLRRDPNNRDPLGLLGQ